MIVLSRMSRERAELSNGLEVMRIRSAMLGFAAVFTIVTTSMSAAMCTRLPLSDVAMSKPAATAAARQKLTKYAVEKLKSRGWTGKGDLKSSNENVACEPYVNLGVLAAGYRCLVTATFCAPSSKPRSSATGQVIKLRLKGSSFEISGVLRKIEKGSYVIVPPDSGRVTVAADRFDCISDICPKAAN
jgi:hypothetical protein